MLPLVRKLVTGACVSFLLLAIAVTKLTGGTLAAGAVRGALLCAALFAYGWVYRFKCNDIPGPAPHLFTGHYYEIFSIGLPRLLRDTWKQYGPVTRVFYGRTPRIVVADPDLIQRLNTTHFATFHDRPTPLTQFRVSTGLLMSRGDRWKRDRNALLPAFNTAQLHGFQQPMDEAVHALTAKLARLTAQPGGSGDIHVMSFWAGLTLEIFGRTAFGFGFGTIDKPLAEQHPIVGAAMGVFDSFKPNPTTARIFQILAAFPFLRRWKHWVDGEHTARHARFIDTLDRNALELVQTRRADPNMHAHADFLTYLISAKTDAKTDAFNDIEVRDQIITFLLAGYETTATALTFATYLLSLPENARCVTRLCDEIDRLTGAEHGRGQRAQCGELSFDELKEFEYTEACVLEALRLYPPLQVIREVGADTTVGPYRVPKGTEVVFSATVMHYDPAHFPEPDVFRPERFLPDSAEERTRHKYAYFPFGAGPRGCIGMRFAMQEAKLALIRVFSAYTFRISPSVKTPIDVVQGITLSSKQPITVTAHRRTKA